MPMDMTQQLISAPIVDHHLRCAHVHTRRRAQAAVIEYELMITGKE